MSNSDGLNGGDSHSKDLGNSNGLNDGADNRGNNSGDGGGAGRCSRGLDNRSDLFGRRANTLGCLREFTVGTGAVATWRGSGRREGWDPGSGATGGCGRDGRRGDRRGNWS